MTWETLEATWRGLTALMDLYKPDSEPYATLTEARRLVEVEMREEGFEKQWEQLPR